MNSLLKKELLVLFTSIRSPLIFFFFMLFLGFFFSYFVGVFADLQSQSTYSGGKPPVVEDLIKALFYNQNFFLVLLIPAMTMSSFSEEKKSKQIKVLLASPITATRVVFAKYLAILAMLVSLIVLSAVYPIYLVIYSEIDVAIIWTSYLGLFLLMCAQAAFGLFVSSLTDSTPAAFLLTISGLFLFLLLDFLLPKLIGNGFLGSFLKYFATTPHFEPFLKGYLSVAHLAYFGVFISGFLFLTMVVYDSERWR